VDSLRTRLDELWKDAGNDFAQSPFVGHGPAKKIFTDIITDSEYLDVLKEFGIIGFCIYLAYYLFPLRLLWKGLRSAKRAGPWVEDRLPAQMMVVRLTFIMIVTAMMMNIGETTFYSQVLQGFLWIWMGIGARSAKTIVDSVDVTSARFAPCLRAIATPRNDGTAGTTQRAQPPARQSCT
jgi:O-antigen ligase